MAEVIADS